MCFPPSLTFSAEGAAMRLDGRTALVTGAAGGIGTALCAAFAASGARVVGLDLPEKPLPVAARAVAADLADLPTAVARVRALDAELGGIDVLVNNAAINPLKPVDGYDLEEFERVQRINAHAALALTQVLVGGMKDRRRGVILNICSITLSGGWSDFSAYVASKGTLLGLTRSLARELGAWDIRVNAISPGAIPTALEREVWADQLESYERFILERQALKYRGSAEDVAHMALYLASDLGRFITGQNVIVDGGWWMG
jgi:NAD(P)-dependent dehydrogenase (short-subunit alcohol dehydrogenase family)